MILHFNLSISGYEPDLLRAQEVSTILQLDGPGSLPMRDSIGRQMYRIFRSVEQDFTQGGTYVQRASVPRRRKYPGGDGNDDGSRRPHRDWRPLREGDIQTKVGDP